MSKEAALRAMREARYDRMMAQETATSRPVRPTVRPTQTLPADPVAPVPPTEQTCGHRSMNGRTCTREHGHAAKSHRYS